MRPGGSEVTRTMSAEIMTAITRDHHAMGTRVHLTQARRSLTFLRVSPGTILAYVYKDGELDRIDETGFSMLVEISESTVPAETHDAHLLQ
jgi:hypothetical protein